MNTRPQIASVDVFLLLRDPDGRGLFGRRAAHLYAGGQWNLVSGRIDENEDAVTAVLREAQEEVGISLGQSDVSAGGCVHYRNPDGGARVGFAFSAWHDPQRHGPVFNAEPDMCDELTWAALGAEPQPLDPYNAAVLALISGQSGIGIAGWTA